jgi:DNA-binding LacI/PurR family transcriptional regulator
VILLFNYNMSTYSHLHESERTAGFMRAFYDEAERCGYQVVPVYPLSLAEATLSSYRPERRVSTLIAALGERFRGVLVLATRKHVPELDEWMSLFAGFGKPVVWFDYHEEGWAGLAPASGNTRLLRAAYDEAGAVRTALQTLVDSGHRRIGIANHLPHYRAWVRRRAECAETMAARRWPNVTIVTENDPVDQVRRHPDRVFVHDLLDILRFTLSPHERKLIDFVIESPSCAWHHEVIGCTPVMSRLLAQGVTAVLAPNDCIAMHLFAWCSAFQVDVPRECSLLSFDNNERYRAVPVSTVDFGMGNLGYVAAQAFVGAAPVKTYPGGRLKPRCRVVHRGSLAPVAGGLRRTTALRLGIGR